ncbi:MAG: hypothetical protein H7Y17_14700 [Chlorobia bacterium]|nr:hypothetical protein [Fimbriimonadaceae bacterium]
MSALPITRPHIDTRPRLRVATGTRPSVASQFMNGALGFLAVAVVTFGASSLSGHVMVEKARRDGIHAGQRLKAAKAAQTVLSVKIAEISSSNELVVWAKRNGFVAPDVAPKPSRKNGVIVASR